MNNKKKANKNKQNSKFRPGQIFISNWHVFVLCVGAFVGLTFAYIQLAPPLYEVSSSVLLKQASNQTSGSNWIQKEIDEISSVELVAKTVSSYHDGILYYSTDAWVPGFLKDFTRRRTSQFPFEIQIKKANADLYGAHLIIEALNDEQYRIVPAAGNKGLVINAAISGAFGKIIKTDNFSIQVDRDENFDIQPDKQYSFVLESDNNLTSQFATSLTAAPVDAEGSPAGLLKLIMTTKAFEDGVNFMEQHISQYEQARSLGKSDQTPQKILSLDNKISSLEDSINQVEAVLAQLKEDTSAAGAPAERKKRLNSLYISLNNSVEKIKSYRTLKNSLLRDKNKSKVELLQMTDKDDADIRQWIDTYYWNLEELDDLLLTVTKNHPSAIRLLRTVEKSREQIVNQANIYIDAQQDRSEALRKRIAYYSRTEQSPDLEDSLKAVTQTYASLNTTLTDLQSERTQAQDLLAGSIRLEVVRKPEASSKEPVWPTNYLYLLACILGTLTALLVVRFTRKEEETITDQDELTSHAKAPLLGMISNGDKELRLINNETAHSSILQSFKFVGVNLNYIRRKGNCNVVGLTSSVNGEGKTFCAVNLAAAMAKEGNKTLLLSLDYGTTSLDEYLSIKYLGLAEHIIGFASVERIVQKSVLQNLDVITPGNLDYLSGEEGYESKIADLIKLIGINYDYIFIKTPSITESSLHFVLTKYFDINLFLVRYNYTRKEILSGINGMYANKKIRNLYLLFNDVNFSQQQEVTFKAENPKQKAHQKQQPPVKSSQDPSDKLSRPSIQPAKKKVTEHSYHKSSFPSSQAEQISFNKEKAITEQTRKIDLIENKTEPHTAPVSKTRETDSRSQGSEQIEAKSETGVSSKPEPKYSEAYVSSSQQKTQPVKETIIQPKPAAKKHSDSAKPQENESLPQNKKEDEALLKTIKPNPLREEIERKREIQLKREKQSKVSKTELEENEHQVDEYHQRQNNSEIPKKEMVDKKEKEEKKQDDNFTPQGTILPHEEYEEPGFFNRIFGKKKKKKTVYKNPFA